MKLINKCNAIFLSLIFVLICTTISAQKIEVTPKNLFLNSNKITKFTSSKELRSILGKPDGIFFGVSTIWTYDKLGLRIYLIPKKLLVESVEFDLIKQNFKFSPKKIFTGIFTINNKHVSRTTLIKDLEELKAINFHHSVLDLYTATNSYLTFTFTISDDDHKIQMIALSFKE